MSMYNSWLRKVGAACAAVVMAFTVAATAQQATANTGEQYPDILLASFFNSQADQSDTLYTSVDGKNFQKIGVAYQDSSPDDPSSAWVTTKPYNVGTLHDPSIMYHNGWFYMLSGFVNHDACPGRFIPMIGYSRDLVHWSYPNSGSQTNVPLATTPASQLDNKFDIVAPEFLRTSSGQVYITFSAGYYGDFHGQPEKDTMFPYLVKLDSLAPGTDDPASNPEAAVKVSYQTAKPINLPEKSTNRIDGSFYEENGVFYYVVKNNGVTNEIWKTTNLDACDQPSNWTKVNGNALTGFEGPSLTRFKGQYWLYTDKLANYPSGHADGKTGIFVESSTNLANGWSGNDRITTRNLDGRDIPNRHGTVITITDPAAKAVVWKAREAAGFKYEAGKNGVEQRDGKTYFWEDGVLAQSKESFVNGYWRWFDADGSMAVSKDVYQPSSGGKWVRYNERGEMIKGEDYRYGGWYYFDPITGAMAKGMRFVPSNGGKWVYYDWVTGQMAHGEAYVSYDAEHTGWYYFDPVTGAMKHGDMFVRSNGGKWVRYDDVTGKMVKGLDHRYGSWYYFLPSTGAMQKGNVYVPEWNAWHWFDPITGRG